MIYFFWLATPLVIASVAVGESKPSGTDFHVAVDGHDRNPGTRSKPIATLRRARDGVRELRK